VFVPIVRTLALHGGRGADAVCAVSLRSTHDRRRGLGALDDAGAGYFLGGIPGDPQNFEKVVIGIVAGERDADGDPLLHGQEEAVIRQVSFSVRSRAL